MAPPRNRVFARGLLILPLCFLSSDASRPRTNRNGERLPLASFELLGHRDLTFSEHSSTAKVFDSHHSAILHRRGGRGPHKLQLVVDGRPVPVVSAAIHADAPGVAYKLVVPQGTLGAGHLTVKMGKATVFEHAVHFERSPLDDPRIAQARRLRKAKDFEAAERLLEPVRTSTDAWVSFWGHLESGDVAYKSGEVADALKYWQIAGQAPLIHLEPGRGSKRLRAAAFVAMNTGHFAESEAALGVAAQLAVRLQDAQGIARGLYFSALLRQLTGEQLAAGRLLRAAIEAAMDAGQELDLQQYRQAYAVHLIKMGQFSSAMELLVSSPPLKKTRMIDRALYHWNLGWVRFAAKAHGFELASRFDPWNQYEEALKLVRAHGTPQREAGLLGNMAEQAIGEGDFDGARRYLDRMPELDSFLSVDGGWRIPYLRVRLSIQAGQLDDASKSLESLWPRRSAPNERLSEERMTWARLAGELARIKGQKGIALERYKEAFKVSLQLERALAVPTAQSAAQWRRGSLSAELAALHLARGSPGEALRVLDHDRAVVVERLFQERFVAGRPELWRAYRDRRTESERLQRAGCAHHVRASTRHVCKSQIEDAKERARAALEQVYEGALGLSTLQPPKERALIAELRAALRPTEALLYLARSDEGGLAIWLTPNEIKGFVGAKSIGKLWPRMARKSHVFVVPTRTQDGVDVFVQGFAGGPPLADITSLSFLPYGRTLTLSSEPSTGRAVVLADPDGSLLMAGHEGDWVEKHLSALRIPVPEPDKAAVLEQWNQTSLFHYAGHADESDGPWGTRLRLGRSDAITLEDLLTIRPASRLAVLNACATGRSTAGVTLPSILLRSGTRSVLATVRVQRDGESKDFIRRFYLAGGSHQPGPAFREAIAQSKAQRDPSWRLFRLWGRP